MTIATKITIGRLLLIPVIVSLAVHYAQTVGQGDPVEGYRWSAVVVFLVASLSDALDGYIARRYQQKSRLGVILDPLADKGLMLAAILTLSLTEWPGGLPLWFATIVISRDGVLIIGALLLNHVVGHVHIRPHWTGKVATFFQMVTLAWVMLVLPGGRSKSGSRWRRASSPWSRRSYIVDGIGQAHASGHGEADADLP